MLNNLDNLQHQLDDLVNDKNINFIRSSSVSNSNLHILPTNHLNKLDEASQQNFSEIISKLNSLTLEISNLINNFSNIKNNNFETVRKDNPILLISERHDKVFLPYTVDEIYDYLKQFPNSYASFEDVVSKEYILPLNYYITRPVLSRFREGYSLCRDREGKQIVESIKYGKSLMFNRKLNPAIIAACKTQEQLSRYLECLETGDLSKFNDFQIHFEVNPI